MVAILRLSEDGRLGKREKGQRPAGSTIALRCGLICLRSSRKSAHCFEEGSVRGASPNATNLAAKLVDTRYREFPLAAISQFGLPTKDPQPSRSNFYLQTIPWSNSPNRCASDSPNTVYPALSLVSLTRQA